MKNILIASLIFPFFISEALCAEHSYTQIESVSIASLLSAPEKFDSKVVRVLGAGNFDFETSQVCLSIEDVRYQLVSNCLRVVVPKKLISADSTVKDYNEKYIILEGVFKMSSTAKTVLVDEEKGIKIETDTIGVPYTGTIKNVTRFQKWYLQPEIMN